MNNPGGIEAFIIHLARAEARRPQVERIRLASPVPVEVVDAVDGRALPAAEIAAVVSRQKLFDPPYPFDLSMGEIGCFLSHRKAWQMIVERGLSAGLVIEDDVEIDRDTFAHAFDLALAHVAGHGIVQFQVRDISDPGPVVAAAGEVRLTRPVRVPLRASCTLYSPAAAQQLLDRTERFDRPVDTFMQMHWITGVHPCLVIPSGVSDRAASVGGTTIQSRREPLLRRLRREVLRPLYRLRIAALSRRHDTPEG